jgi:hypothetical protein
MKAITDLRVLLVLSFSKSSTDASFADASLACPDFIVD